MAHKKLVKDDNVNLDLLGAVLHYLLEDDTRKRQQQGNSLLVKIELRNKLTNMDYEIKGVVGNEDYLVMSLRFYDAKTEIKKGEFADNNQEDKEN